MARCDQGYLCRVCGEEVEAITDSELYLKFVIGEIDPEVLHLESECHLLCNPTLSQFIDDERFQSQPLSNPLFSREALDPSFVEKRRELLNRGYRRLWEIRGHRAQFPKVQDYPLPDVISKWSGRDA